MLNSIFSGLFSYSETAFSVTGFLICIISALVLGALIAVVHMKTSRTSGSFAVTLAVLPAIVAVIIMMVNGSIGAGIAVAGSFSLVRFRSVPGSAKEIASVFLAMATGLACGMGYPVFGLIFAAILCLMLVFYSRIRFGESKGNDRLRSLTIMMPEDLNYTHVFDDVFERFTTEHKLEKIKTTSLGSLNKITYQIRLRDPGSEKALIDELRCRNGNLEIILSEPAYSSAEL